MRDCRALETEGLIIQFLAKNQAEKTGEHEGARAGGKWFAIRPAISEQSGMSNGKNEVAISRLVGRVVSILAAAMLAGTGGCAHTHGERARNPEAKILPNLTSIITGPAALLLTNASGFQSEYQLSLDDHGKAPAKPLGLLFVRGAEIEVTLGGTHGGAGSGGAFTVVWDAAAGKGYVSSEALQGYAPLGGVVGISNFVMQAAGGSPQRLDGHLVEKVIATATSTNGERLSWELESDVEHGHLPVAIHSLQGAPSFTLTLTKVQSSVPPEGMFLRAFEFKQYGSEEALLTELELREQEYQGGGLGRGANGDDHSGPGGPRQGRE
jgi:hypothetical protein